MKDKDWLVIIICLLFVCTGIFGGYQWGKHATLKKIEDTPADTVYVEKEIQAPVPEPKIIEKVRTEYIEVPCPIIGENKTDTMFIPVPIPIEQKEYKDSLYRAYVSGYKPSLDSIFINSSMIYITNTVEKTIKPKFTFGLQGGVGAVFPFGQKPGLGGYVGLGINYTF